MFSHDIRSFLSLAENEAWPGQKVTKLLFGPARRDKKYLKAGYKVLFDLARRDIKYFIEPAGRDIKYFISRLVSLSSNVVGYNEFEAGLRMNLKVSSKDRKSFKRKVTFSSFISISIYIRKSPKVYFSNPQLFDVKFKAFKDICSLRINSNCICLTRWS